MEIFRGGLQLFRFQYETTVFLSSLQRASLRFSSNWSPISALRVQLSAVHYAREIWLTFPKSRGIVDRAGKFHPNSEDLLNFALLRGFGVPTQAIRVLEAPIVNTADELNAIDAGLKEIGGTSVIIVTNKAHSRRVFSLWDKYHFLDGQVLIHAVSDDQFAPSRWWKSASSRAQAIHELFGNLNVWADMPVRRPLPASSNLGSIFWFMYSTTR